ERCSRVHDRDPVHVRLDPRSGQPRGRRRHAGAWTVNARTYTPVPVPPPGEPARPLTADDIEELVTQNRCRVADAIRALYPEEPMATDVLAHAVRTALTEPTRPEEKDA